MGLWPGQTALAVAWEMTAVFGVAVMLIERAAFDDALFDGGEVVRADPAVIGGCRVLR